MKEFKNLNRLAQIGDDLTGAAFSGAGCLGILFFISIPFVYGLAFLMRL